MSVSLGSSRSLYWRRMSMSNKGTNSNWVDDKTFRSVFTLYNNAVTIINPNNKHPLSIKNSMRYYQYIFIRITGLHICSLQYFRNQSCLGESEFLCT